MRRLLATFLLVGLLAAVPMASAQGGPAPARGERVVVSLVTLAGGVAVPLMVYTASTATWGSNAGRVVILATAPVGMAAGTVLGADLFGLRAPAFPEALADAALGYVVGGAAFVVIGVGVGGGLHYALGQPDYDFITPAIGVTAGLAVGLPLVLNLSTRSVEAAPSVLVAPTGERAPGLSLRIGL